MESDKDQRVAAMEARWDAIIPTLATKADVESLRADMHRMIAETHKWMVGSLIGLFIGFGGLGYSLAQILRAGPSPPAPAQAAPIPAPVAVAPTPTIVINIPPPVLPQK